MLILFWARVLCVVSVAGLRVGPWYSLWRPPRSAPAETLIFILGVGIVRRPRRGTARWSNNIVRAAVLAPVPRLRCGASCDPPIPPSICAGASASPMDRGIPPHHIIPCRGVSPAQCISARVARAVRRARRRRRPLRTASEAAAQKYIVACLLQVNDSLLGLMDKALDL